MPKIWFTNYADENYVKQQIALNETAKQSGVFDVIRPWSYGEVAKTEFYEKHHEILNSKERDDDGRVKPGWFLFKPFIILETLKEMNEGDILLYIDCGDTLHETETLREFLLSKAREYQFNMLLTMGAFPASMYCKRDAFILMGCDAKEYHEAIQIEAGILVFKKTTFTALVVQEWLHYCSDRRIISDDENVCGEPNLPGFKWHRWDQAALSNLRVRMGLNVGLGNEMRKFVHCNSND